MVRQPSLNAQHRAPLSRERIIEAALHLIDAQGLSRLTMRRLGDALEVEAMAIYHHLPRGKEELLDGLVTYVAARPAHVAAASAADWRGTLRSWAEDYRATLLGHSGVLPLLVTRRNPPALAATAASLREVLRAGGVAEAPGATGAHALLSYVIGHAALEVRGAGPDGADAPIDWNARFTAGLNAVLAGISPPR